MKATYEKKRKAFAAGRKARWRCKDVKAYVLNLRDAGGIVTTIPLPWQLQPTAIVRRADRNLLAENKAIFQLQVIGQSHYCIG